MWRRDISRVLHVAIPSILPFCPSLLPKEDGNICKVMVSEQLPFLDNSSLRQVLFLVSLDRMYSIG